MNYPLQQLAIIGPILFIVLMVAFPVIGVFGGWKRAAYWGGGNFVFYIIGMLVWRFTSGGIVNLITPLLQDLAPQADFSKIAISITAPIFFLLVLIVANLLLVINYYAWFKRVAGLTKYKKVKKTDAQGHVTKVKVQVQKNKSTTYRVINYVAGGVGMTALMLPTTFSLTQTVMLATTSVTTRKDNKFATNVYNMLSSVNSKMTWFSYWTNDSVKDFDALFAGLAMQNKKIEGTFTYPDGTTVENPTVIDALSGTFEKGISQIYESTTQQDPTKPLSESIEDFADSWNGIVGASSDEMTAFFSSENATEVMQGLLEVPDSSGTTLTEEQIKSFTSPTGEFQKQIEIYANNGTFDKVEISQDCYNNMVESVMGMYTLDTTDTKLQDQFRESIYDMMGLLFAI